MHAESYNGLWFWVMPLAKGGALVKSSILLLILQNQLLIIMALTNRRRQKSKYCLVLLSGGIDSTACIHYYLSQDYEVQGVFIDYGQKANEKEAISAEKIVLHYKIDLNKLTFKTTQNFNQGEIKGRNAFLVLAAILAYPDFKGIIALGIHSDTPYYDCSRSFVNDMNNILREYSSGQVLLDTPFLKWNKTMIYKYCKDNDVPVYLTYSCENGGENPCGKCLSCRERGVEC